MAARRHRGFTLIELLVALFITAIMFAFGYRALDEAFKSRREIDEQSARLIAVQQAVRTLEQDFELLSVLPDALTCCFEPLSALPAAVTCCFRPLSVQPAQLPPHPRPSLDLSPRRGRGGLRARTHRRGPRVRITGPRRLESDRDGGGAIRAPG